MNCSDRVSSVLTSANLATIVDRVRRECDAIAAAVLSCSIEGISVVAAAPPQHRDAGAWLQSADDCLTVMESGVPVERRGAITHGEPSSTIICPVDGAGLFRGVIAIRREHPFSIEEVDFVRLLGIELGGAFESVATAREDGVNARRAAAR